MQSIVYFRYTSGLSTEQGSPLRAAATTTTIRRYIQPSLGRNGTAVVRPTDRDCFHDLITTIVHLIYVLG